jgi:hypothetical protein
MPNIFEIAARRQFRYASKVGPLTTEQLFGLPLTSTTGKANLNDIAVSIDDERETLGRKSFVETAATNPARAELDVKLEVVKFVIASKQDEAAAERDRRAKREQRDKLLDAIEQADRRELGSKSADELRAELSKLND